MTLLRSVLFASLLATAACAHRRGPVQVAAPNAVGADHADARRLLAEAAGDLDEAVRARALGALVSSSPEAAGGPWAPRGLYDPSPWVQRAAVDALQQRHPEPASRTLLAKTAQRTDLDTYVRCAAAAALQTDAPPGLLVTVQQAEGAAAAPWRAAPCALAAAQLGDTAAVSRLGAILAEGDLPLDIRFLDDVGASGFTALVPFLIEASMLVEDALLPAVGAALLQLGSARGESLLKDGLTSSNPERQLESLDFLADIEDESATSALRRAENLTSGDARTYAGLILMGRNAGDPDLAEQAATSSNRELRALAMQHAGQALAQHQASPGDPRVLRKLEKSALDLFLRGAEDPDDPVREAAAVALGALCAAPAARDRLEGLLRDDNPRVQVEAAISLLDIRETRALVQVPALRPAGD